MQLKTMMPPSGNLMTSESTELTKNYRQLNPNITNFFCPLYITRRRFSND